MAETHMQAVAAGIQLLLFYLPTSALKTVMLMWGGHAR